jgi:hypothetical protein
MLGCGDLIDLVDLGDPGDRGDRETARGIRPSVGCLNRTRAR